jgi:hypothetical protein
MGGGGGILSPITNAIFGSPQTVATPNYSQAAQDTAAANLKNAQLATSANRVNQNTPYGSLNYSSSTDQYGNPVWSATQSLSPQLQSLVNTNLGNIGNQYATNFTGGNLPSYGIDPGQTYSDAIMQRLAPQLAQQSESSDVKLANMGITPGSEAYNRAKTLLYQSQNDARTSAIVNGMNVGLQANQQQYNQNLQNYNNPLAVARNIQGLTQQNFVNPYNQAAVPGADYTSAAGLTNQGNQANANAQNAYNANMIGGLFGLGAGALMSPKGTFSSLISPTSGGGSTLASIGSQYG